MKKLTSRTWLVVDVSNLAYKAWHTTGDLSHEGIGTGVLFGFLKMLRSMQASYGTKHVAFCFDLGPYKRKKLYPNYKSNPAPVDNEERENARQEVRRQIDLLRTDYLERVGYRNVLFQKGYEADDVIASVVNNLPDRDRAVIVSGDHDLYQLLSDRVTIHRWTTNGAHGNMTLKVFRKEFEIEPDQWPTLKAIIGGKDNLPGAHRIGMVTATAYLKGRSVNATCTKVIEEWLKSSQYVVNKQLARVPYEGCKKFEVVEDDVSKTAWDHLMKSLGMRTLKMGDF